MIITGTLNECSLTLRRQIARRPDTEFILCALINSGIFELHTARDYHLNITPEAQDQRHILVHCTGQQMHLILHPTQLPLELEATNAD